MAQLSELSVNNPISVRDRKVAPLSEKLTHLEALVWANFQKRTLPPHAFYHRLLREKDKHGDYKYTLREISNLRPFATGTVFVVGDNGKPLGKRIEKECRFQDEKKTVIYEPDDEHANLRDVMLMCDQGFTEGRRLVELLNAANDKQLISVADLTGASEIRMQFKGVITPFKIKSREGGIMHTSGHITSATYNILEPSTYDTTTYTYISNSATFGLLERSISGRDSITANVYAGFGSDGVCGLLVYDRNR